MVYMRKSAVVHRLNASDTRIAYRLLRKWPNRGHSHNVRRYKHEGRNNPWTDTDKVASVDLSLGNRFFI